MPAQAGGVPRHDRRRAAADHAASRLVHAEPRAVRRRRELVPLRRRRGRRRRPAGADPGLAAGGARGPRGGRHLRHVRHGRSRRPGLPAGAVPGGPHLARDPRGRPARQGLPRREARSAKPARVRARTPDARWPRTRSTTSGATSGRRRSSGRPGRRTAAAGRRTREPEPSPRTTRDRLRHGLGVRPPGRRAADGPQARDVAVHAARRQARARRDTGRVRRPRGRRGDRAGPRRRRPGRARRLDLAGGQRAGRAGPVDRLPRPAGQPDPRPLGEIEELRWLPLDATRRRGRAAAGASTSCRHWRSAAAEDCERDMQTSRASSPSSVPSPARRSPLVQRRPHRRRHRARPRQRPTATASTTTATEPRIADDTEHRGAGSPVPARRHAAPARRVGRARRVRRVGAAHRTSATAPRPTPTGVPDGTRLRLRDDRRHDRRPVRRPTPGRPRPPSSSTASRPASTSTTRPGPRTGSRSSTAGPSTGRRRRPARWRPSRSRPARCSVLLGPLDRAVHGRRQVVTRTDARLVFELVIQDGPSSTPTSPASRCPSRVWTDGDNMRAQRTDPGALATKGLTDPRLFAATADWSPDGAMDRLLRSRHPRSTRRPTCS